MGIPKSLARTSFCGVLVVLLCFRCLVGLPDDVRKLARPERCYPQKRHRHQRQAEIPLLHLGLG